MSFILISFSNRKLLELLMGEPISGGVLFVAALHNEDNCRVAEACRIHSSRNAFSHPQIWQSTATTQSSGSSVSMNVFLKFAAHVLP